MNLYPCGCRNPQRPEESIRPCHWSYRWIWAWCPGMLGSELQTSAKGVFLTSEPASPNPGLLLVDDGLVLLWVVCLIFWMSNNCLRLCNSLRISTHYRIWVISPAHFFSEISCLPLSPSVWTGWFTFPSPKTFFCYCLIWGLLSPSFLIYPKRGENKSLRNCMPEIPPFPWSTSLVTEQRRSASAAQWAPGLLHAHRVPGLHTSRLDAFVEQSEAILIADLLGGKKSLFYFWGNF